MLLLMRMVTNIFIYIVLALLNQRIVIQNILILTFLLVKSHLRFHPRLSSITWAEVVILSKLQKIILRNIFHALNG